jgi:hypothetical protein
MTVDVFVPPAGVSATGFVTNNSEDRHGHHDKGWNSGDARGFYESQAAALAASQSSNDFNRASADRQQQAIREAIDRNGASNALATEKTGAAGILATNVASAGLGVAVERNAAATNLAIEKTAAATNLAIEKTAAADLLEATKNAAAAALASAVTTAQIMAAQAECCCEMKELVKEEAGRTRDLVNATNLADSHRREADLQNQLNMLRFQTGVLDK